MSDNESIEEPDYLLNFYDEWFGFVFGLSIAFSLPAKEDDDE